MVLFGCGFPEIPAVVVVAVLDILDRLLDPLFVVVVAFDLSSLPMLFPTRIRKKYYDQISESIHSFIR